MTNTDRLIMIESFPRLERLAREPSLNGTSVRLATGPPAPGPRRCLNLTLTSAASRVTKDTPVSTIGS